MTAEATNPTAPTIMRMTPTVESRNPWSYNQNLWIDHLIESAAYLPS